MKPSWILGAPSVLLILLSACIPAPNTIPPQMPTLDHASHAAGISVSAGRARPTRRDTSCVSEADGGSPAAPGCWRDLQVWQMNQGRRFSGGAIAYAGPRFIGVGGVGRISVVDRPRHRLNIGGSLGVAWGAFEVGYGVAVHERVWLYTQPQIGVAPQGTFAHLPIGMSLRASEHVYLTADLTASRLVDPEQRSNALRGGLGLAFTWGERPERDAEREADSPLVGNEVE